MNAPQLVAASVFVALALASAGSAAQPAKSAPSKAAPAKSAPSKAAPAKAAPAASQDPTRITPFTHFGADAAIELNGNGAAASLGFGNRGDELVTRATLHLHYPFSPALAPGASMIRVALNDEEIGTLTATAQQAGATVDKSIEIDPRLVAGSNRLTMTLTAVQGTAVAGDDTRPGLWAEVSGGSDLEIAYQPLTVADDLAVLPEPFFDKRDQRRVSVPFVFAAEPSIATLNAAAVVASWLGKLAEWRGVRFPVSLEAPAPGHSIAFITNKERPAFLAAVPQAAGPEVRIMANPYDGRSKLLLVMGRDPADVKVAADALALGGAKWSGPAVKASAAPRAERAPYDAPAFLKLDRPVRFAELLDWPKQLDTSGRVTSLPSVRADLRIPPDLATWRGPGVPVVLGLTYNPTACTTEGLFEVTANGDPLSVMPLRAGTNELISETRELYIPAYRLRPRLSLQFTFRFTPKAVTACSANPPATRASVSPESTIDFSGFPHYAQMPNLNHFATVGYPFTKMADLSQTVVVLPERPVAPDIEAMLGLMGRMGEATEYPATGVRLATSKDDAKLADADLLVVGATPQQALLVQWASKLPVMLTGYSQRVTPKEPTRFAELRGWLGIGTRSDVPPPAPVAFDGGGPVATVFGFESPVTSGRSVVAVTAVAPSQVLHVLDALEDREQRNAMRGNVAFVLPGKVESALVGKTYDVGFMPPWTGGTYWAMENPVPAVGMVLLALMLITMIAWWVHFRVTMRGRATQ